MTSLSDDASARETLAVSVAQFSGFSHWQESLQACLGFVSQSLQAGTDLLVLPEASLRTRDRDTDSNSQAQPLDGRFVTALREATSGTGLTVIVGTVERHDDARDLRPSNTLVALQGGRIISVYRKVHLYDAFTDRESDRLRPGDGPLECFDVNGWRVGMMTCYDIRFPETARVLADLGVELIALPSAWVAGPQKESHWQILCRSRALENTSYLAASDKNGPTRIGLSTIIDPLGTPVASLGAETGLTTARLSRAHLSAVRRRLPVLLQRRFTTSATPTPTAPVGWPSTNCPSPTESTMLKGINDAE